MWFVLIGVGLCLALGMHAEGGCEGTSNDWEEVVLV
jgi:hypothetical protein